MELEKIIAVKNDKIFYRDGEFCIKVFNRNYSAADVLNEALNQARMQESGLNVPRVVEVTTFDGNWAIVYEYIVGKTLAELMEEDADKKDEYLKLLVELQYSVCSQPAPLLNNINDRLSRRIKESELDAITRCDLIRRLENMPKHSKVCHGDFNPSNIIIKEDGTPYIIDWSHSTRGNASADVARTYLGFYLSGDMENAEKYLDLYCEKSRTDKEYIKKWIPIVAAAESVTASEKDSKVLLSLAAAVDSY